MSDAIPTMAEIIDFTVQAMFGKPIVENVQRGPLVEAIVAYALRNQGWSRTDAWAGWDLIHQTGIRLEVRQKAAQQTWDQTRTVNREGTRFDIAARTGHYDSEGWHKNDDGTRYADIYVFAYHPVKDATADHRKPAQWRFYVLPARSLPKKKSISLRLVRFLVPAVRVDGLRAKVAAVMDDIADRDIALPALAP